MALLHTLSPAIEIGERVLGVLIALASGAGKPIHSLGAILFRAKSSGVHLANPVFQETVRLLLLSDVERLEGLGIPLPRLFRVNLTAETVRQHPAKVKHGKDVARQCFFQKQCIGLCMVLGTVIAAEEKAAGVPVTVTPPHGGLRLIVRRRIALHLFAAVHR